MINVLDEKNQILPDSRRLVHIYDLLYKINSSMFKNIVVLNFISDFSEKVVHLAKKWVELNNKKNFHFFDLATWTF